MPTGSDYVAKASIAINAPVLDVWHALTDPATIEKYMFGSHVTSDWTEGSTITWKGEWQGKAYADKGVILQFDPGRTIQYSHFSPLSGLPDKAENYHTVTIQLSAIKDQTQVILSQDNNSTQEDRAHSEQNWGMMLASLKNFLEK